MQIDEAVVAPNEPVGVEGGARDATTVGPVNPLLAGEIGQFDGGVRIVDVDATTMQPVVAVKCKKHSRYRGLRRPSNGCKGCMALYEYARATGVRETRKKRVKEAA